MKNLINIRFNTIFEKITNNNSSDASVIPNKKDNSIPTFKMYAWLDFENDNHDEIIDEDVQVIDYKKNENEKEFNSIEDLLIYLFYELLDRYSENEKYRILFTVAYIFKGSKFKDDEKDAIQIFIQELKTLLEEYLKSDDFTNYNKEYKEKINLIKFK